MAAKIDVPKILELVKSGAVKTAAAKQEATAKADPKSRRRVPRRAFEANVGVLSGGKYAISRSYQIGEGGMMIAFDSPLTVGAMLVVSFVLNLGSLITVRAVVRSQIPASKGYPHRYGVEFLNLGFQYKREIRNFVAAATHDDGQTLQDKLRDGRHGF